MKIDGSVIVSIIIAVIGSSWFGNYMSSRLSKNTIIESIQAIEKKIDDNNKKNDERFAKNARTKILRFDDELRMHMKHSKEYFDNVIEDIDEYETYCRNNQHFKNRKAESAIEHIMKAYNQCHEQNDFL